MSDSKDAKDSEPVRLPPQPPVDMRAGDGDPNDENGPIQAEDFAWAWNTRPHNQPVETESETRPEDESSTNP